METQTVVNGKEYKNYDKFQRFIEHLEKEFVNQKEYKGFPKLPNDYNDGLDIYLTAESIDEKRFIFGYLYTLYLEALRHWKVDKDMLWTERGRKEHQEFIEKITPLTPYMKKDWDSFR